MSPITAFLWGLIARYPDDPCVLILHQNSLNLRRTPQRGIDPTFGEHLSQDAPRYHCTLLHVNKIFVKPWQILYGALRFTVKSQMWGSVLRVWRNDRDANMHYRHRMPDIEGSTRSRKRRRRSHENCYVTLTFLLKQRNATICLVLVLSLSSSMRMGGELVAGDRHHDRYAWALRTLARVRFVKASLEMPTSAYLNDSLAIRGTRRVWIHFAWTIVFLCFFFFQNWIREV